MFEIEVIDTTGEEETVIETYEARDGADVGNKVEALNTLNRLDEGTEARITVTKNRFDLQPRNEVEEAILDAGIDDSEDSDDLPQPGDHLTDPESDYGTGEVVVEAIPTESAGEYVINGGDRFRHDITVAGANDCDEDEPVVEASYVNGGDTIYAFPASRLEE